MGWLAAPLHPIELAVLTALLVLSARRLYPQLPPSELPWLRVRLRTFVAACRARLLWDAARGALLTVLLAAAAWLLLPGPWSAAPPGSGPLALVRGEPVILVRALWLTALLFCGWLWLAPLFSGRHRWLKVMAQLREKGRRADLSPDARRWCSELAACTRFELLLALHERASERAAAIEAWRRWTGGSARHPADLFWAAVLKLARREDPQLDAKSEAYQRIRARFSGDAARLRGLCAEQGTELLDRRRLYGLKAGPWRLALALLLLLACTAGAWLWIASVRPAADGAATLPPTSGD